MIHILDDSESLCVEVSGHAGYAEIGRDIVCSAISTLTLTLAEYARSHNGKADITDGYAIVSLRNTEKAREVYMAILRGMRSISEGYAQWVDFREYDPM